MLYFIYGPDEFRIRQKIKILIEDFRKNNPSGSIYAFDLNETPLEDAVNLIKARSLFEDARFIWVKNLFSQKSIITDFINTVKDLGLLEDKNIHLAVVQTGKDSELTKHKELFKFLTESPVKPDYVPFLTSSQLELWIKAQFAERNCAIEFQAIKKLINLVGSDSWTLSLEIDKISNYKLGSMVTTADVGSLVSVRENLNIFNLIDALANKDRPKALDLLYREINSGRDPYYILTMITYQFRNMLMAKDLFDQALPLNTIIKKIGLHPFAAQKINQSAKKFTLPELKNIYANLASMDTATKEGTNNLTDSLYGLIITWK